MDEFFESLVLIQTLKQASFPVILMGSDYWQGLVQWMNERMLKEHRYISPEEFEAFRTEGLERGFLEVVAGPMVRSSYRAEQVLQKNNVGLAV